MTTVGELITRIADRTSPDQTPAWDPVGLQLGDSTASVSSVAVCHEVTEEVVDVLTHEPVDVLVAYHPLLFTPTNRVLKDRSPGGRAFRLVSLGVNLVVTHTDFDATDDGTADALADLFGILDPEPFGGDPESGLPDIGRYGPFQGSLATVDAIISDTFGPMGARVSGDRDSDVQTLAVVPGSGSSLISEAARFADALVTGDVSHHKCVEALDLGLSIVDPGHVATERPGMPNLVRMVAETSGLEVTDLTELTPQTWS